VISIAALLLVRGCLPIAVELGIEATGGRVLAGDVEVGNVDFGLLAGRIRVEGLRVGQADAAQPVPLADLSLVEVDLAPAALFGGRVHLEDAVVEGLHLHLPRDAEGRFENPLLVALALPETVPPIQVDRARVADLSVDFLDPYSEVPLFEARLEKLGVSGLGVEANSVAIGDVELIAPFAFVDRGLIEGPRSLTQAYPPGEETTAEGDDASAEGGEPAVDAEPAEAAAPFELVLGRLLIRDLAVAWMDRSFTPPLEERQVGLTLQAEDLRLSEQGLAALTIDGSGLRGERFLVTAASGEQGLDVRLESEPIRLDPFDPYARSLGGFAIEDGRIAVTSQISMQGARIKSEHVVTLYDLKVDGDTFLRDVIGFGANLVFALLADDEGIVQLTFPVDHDLDQSLDENVKSTVSAVLRSAMRDAVADAGGTLGKDGRIGFEPFGVLPGSTELEPGQEARLEYLGELLARRDQLVLVLTGSVDDRDRAVLAEARGLAPEELPVSDLEALAARRAAEIRRILVESHSVPAGRLSLDVKKAEGRAGVLAAIDVRAG
jgi:hypothetical protein